MQPMPSATAHAQASADGFATGQNAAPKGSVSTVAAIRLPVATAIGVTPPRRRRV